MHGIIYCIEVSSELTGRLSDRKGLPCYPRSSLFLILNSDLAIFHKVQGRDTAKTARNGLISEVSGWNSAENFDFQLVTE